MNSTQSLSMNPALLNDRERTLEGINARTYSIVQHYVREQGGTDEDAKDIFQEALITNYEKMFNGQLTSTASVSIYLMDICKNSWRQQLEKQDRYVPLS